MDVDVVGAPPVMSYGDFCHFVESRTMRRSPSGEDADVSADGSESAVRTIGKSSS